MGLKGRCRKGFIQEAVRIIIGPKPPLFHDHGALLVELSQHRVGHPVCFHRCPERQPVGREADCVPGHILTCGGIQADRSMALIEQRHLVAHHQFAGSPLRVLESLMEFLHFGSIRARLGGPLHAILLLTLKRLHRRVEPI